MLVLSQHLLSIVLTNVGTETLRKSAESEVRGLVIISKCSLFAAQQQPAAAKNRQPY